MTRNEFLDKLKKGLSGLPDEDVDRGVEFYGEMIDDRTEDGLSEEEAVADIGSVEEAISQILSEIPLTRLIKEKVKPKGKLRAWEIVLIALGSPIWLSLLIAAFAVILSVYVVIWSVIASLWAVFASLLAVALGGFIIGVAAAVKVNAFSGIAIIGAALVCAGISIFMFFGCVAATKGTAWLTKKIALGIKKCFAKKEDVK